VTVFIAPSQPTHAFRAGSISTSPSVKRSRSLNSFPFSTVVSPKLLLLGNHQSQSIKLIQTPRFSSSDLTQTHISLHILLTHFHLSNQPTHVLFIRLHLFCRASFPQNPHTQSRSIRNTSLHSREVHNRRPGPPTGAIVEWEASAGPCTKTARVDDGFLSDR
jgi:hypothetical protein